MSAFDLLLLLSTIPENSYWFCKLLKIGSQFKCYRRTAISGMLLILGNCTSYFWTEEAGCRLLNKENELSL